MSALMAIRTVQDVCDANLTSTREIIGKPNLRNEYTVKDMEFFGLITEYGDINIATGILSLVNKHLDIEVC